MGLLAIAFWTPLHHLGLHYLLTAHLLQNVILAEWAPLLAVLGLSRPMAEALGARHARGGYSSTLPSHCRSGSSTTTSGTCRRCTTPRSNSRQWLIHVEHACYFATGVAMWWPLVQDVPRRLASGARAGYAFAAFVLASPIGLLLALLPRPVYAYYVHVPTRVWGLSPLADQEIAGVTMASEQAVVLFVIFLFWFRRFLAEEA